MKRLISLLISSTVLAATLSLSASAQEYSNGGICKKGRKEATLTPVEAFGVHPPGPDPADAHRCIFHRWRYAYIPYYAPVAPIATSVRWKPWCYFPLMPYYTPYYIGYCPKRLHTPNPPPYGSDGWGHGPMPGHEPGVYPLNYGAYTSILQDDTIFWNMGGNGLVPYGAPRPPHEGPPDLVDAIQTTRMQGGTGPGGACMCPPEIAPVADANPGPAAEVLPPPQKQSENGAGAGDKDGKETPPAKESGAPE